MAMTKRTLVIPLYRDGRAEVVGYPTAVENLWVHRGIVEREAPWVRARGGYWTVTHGPTGCAVAMGLKSRAAALEFAEAVSAGDWSFTDAKDMTDETRRVGRRAVAAIKDELYV